MILQCSKCERSMSWFGLNVGGPCVLCGIGRLFDPSADSAPGPYSIGSDTWPGLSKLIEEAGEVLQIAGKLLGTGGATEHWDGKGDLAERLSGELGDLLAAIYFVRRECPLDHGIMAQRQSDKQMLFNHWHTEQKGSKPVVECDGSDTCPAEQHILGCFRSPPESMPTYVQSKPLTPDTIEAITNALEAVANDPREPVRYREMYLEALAEFKRATV